MMTLNEMRKFFEQVDIFHPSEEQRYQAFKSRMASEAAINLFPNDKGEE